MLSESLPFIAQIAIVVLIGGFMPITAFSFFRIMMDKKVKIYNKALSEMGIKSSRKVGDTYSPSKYILPVFFVTLICVLAIASIIFEGQFIGASDNSLLLTSGYFENGNMPLINQSMRVIGFAFLGGFIWSAGNIIRRMIAYDLSPSVYYNAGIRIILAAIIALVLSFILGAEGSTNLVSFNASLPAIALLTGMFPERVLQYLVKVFKRYVGGDNEITKQLSLYNIEGISMQHKERFEEIGIDNAQNLATSSLTQLLIETPFEARQLLDWIGQAKLLCYVKGDIDKFRSVGIRSIFDLHKGQKSREAIMEISDAIEIHRPLLQVVYDQVQDDEGIKALHHFQQRLNSPMVDKIVAAENL